MIWHIIGADVTLCHGGGTARTLSIHNQGPNPVVASPSGTGAGRPITIPPGSSALVTGDTIIVSPGPEGEPSFGTAHNV
jgi:hypothetical protein